MKGEERVDRGRDVLSHLEVPNEDWEEGSGGSSEPKLMDLEVES